MPVNLKDVLNCPFCGAEPVDNYNYISCSNYYCFMNHHSIRKSHWNTRADREIEKQEFRISDKDKLGLRDIIYSSFPSHKPIEINLDKLVNDIIQRFSLKQDKPIDWPKERERLSIANVEYCDLDHVQAEDYAISTWNNAIKACKSAYAQSREIS